MRKTLRISLVAVAMLLLTTLVACTPKDPEAAVKKLEKADYTVLSSTESNLVKAGLVALGISVEDIIVAYKGDKNSSDAIMALYFKSKDDAKKQMEKVEEFAKESEEDGEELKVYQSGKWLYFGSDDAVKAFK